MDIRLPQVLLIYFKRGRKNLHHHIGTGSKTHVPKKNQEQGWRVQVKSVSKELRLLPIPIGFWWKLTWSCCWASCVAQTHTVSLCVWKISPSVVFCVVFLFTLMHVYQSVSAAVHPHTNFSPTLFPLVHMIFMEVQLGRKVLFAGRCLCSLSCCLLCSSALQTFDTNQLETGWFRSYLRMLGGHFHWKHSRSWSYLDHSCATLVLN